MNNPLITYHVNTFNRLPFLKNLIKSFDICNVNPNYEWVIADYGSKDGTREFLVELSKQRKDIVVLLRNEEEYFEYLKEQFDLYPPSRRKKAHSIFGFGRNQIREIAKGNFFFDIADDHQFCVKHDWIKDILSVYEHRKNKVGTDDICVVLYRGIEYQRLLKPNNESEPIEISNCGVEYFVAKYKSYDDYHMMSKETFQKIGPFFQPDKILSEEDKLRWRKGDDELNHYNDYLVRTKELGLKKIFLKFPFVVQFSNNTDEPSVGKSGLFIEPISLNKLKYGFLKNLKRPVSSEELIQLSLSS